MPETKGRSLEELDELFARNVPAREFSRTLTHGAGARLAQLEGVQGGQFEVFEDEATGVGINKHDEALVEQIGDRSTA